jgi:putative zinc finger/helix-turn-helix YgiT family protein
MNSDNLIKKVNYECPFCDQNHLIEIKKRITKSLVKNEPVEYEQVFYYCNVEDEEFVPAKIMDENLLKARDAYRVQKGLLTSEQIKEIRQSYCLTQKEFSNLLGWGDVTIQRYEKKLIQDETYDHNIRMVGSNPAFALELLIKHKENNIEETKYEEVKRLIKHKIKENANAQLKQQEISNCYLEFEEKSDFNGFRELDLEKTSNVMGYFAKFINPLYKVKLMKLLWYSDTLHYNKFGLSMTGLVYQHLPMGAVPVAHNELLSLPSIKVTEELFDDFNVGYRIYSNQEINLSAFSLEELSILEKVATFFRDKTTPEVVSYMHREKAYTETANNQIILYSLSKEIKEF